MYNRLVKNKRLILSLPLLLASLFLASQAFPSAHAALNGLVCITPSTTATSCPSSPPSLGPFSVGQTFTVGVFIQGSNAMGGFDIYVMSNNGFVSPTSAALGTLIATPSLTSICVNGVASTGSCTVGTANGLGVVEVTTIEGSGGNECGGISPCSGLAFTITYSVVALSPGTSLSYPTAAGCATSSVATPPNVCVLIADNVGTSLPETIQGATVTAPGLQDPTATIVSCSSPIGVGAATSCTATVTDTATSGATNPTGTVMFSTSGSGMFTPNPCPSLTASGTTAATCVVSYTPNAVGTGIHTISASYSGDSTHQTSTAAAFALTVTKASPGLTTTVSSTSIPIGNSVSDQAMLTGGFPSTGVTGTVTYTLFPNGACTAPGTAGSTVTVGPSNSVPASAPVTPAAAGSYSFNAVYSGDGSNNAVTSPCEPFTVASAPSFTSGKIHWTHHLSLSKSSGAQSWTAIVANPLSSSINVVIRIVGASTTNPSMGFDVTCGVTCVNTAAGGVNATPGLAPVSVPAATSSFSFSFNQLISGGFAGQKVTFTATLYWSTGTTYIASNSKSGAFAIVA